MTKERNFGLDLIRSFAILFVIAVHFFKNTNFYSTIEIVPDFKIFILLILRWLFFICVPLFLILTGYLNNKKELNKKYYNGIKKLLSSYLFIAIITAFARIFIFKEKHRKLYWIKNILGISIMGNNWYLKMYLGLFLLIPFLNILYKNLTKKQKQIFIITCVLLSGGATFINYYKILGTTVDLLPNYWSSIYPFTYYFIGAYICEYKPNPQKKNLIIGLIATLIFEVVNYICLDNGKLFGQSIFGGYGSVLTVIISTLFFLLFYNIKVKGKIFKTIVTRISIVSFDMYLITYLTDRITYPIFNQYIITTTDYLIYIIPVVLIASIMPYILCEIKSLLFYLIKSKKQQTNEI